ncbi:MAG: hypothetical protein B7Z73_07485, partial [Planctomycetia bacterium 21-64-5]
VWQADDIDGVTWLDGEPGPPGSLVEVTIEDVDEYDFRATVAGLVSVPPRPGRRRPRSLRCPCRRAS